jgi:outer membrane protein TolC
MLRFIANTLFISLAVLFLQTRASAQQFGQEPIGIHDLDTNRAVEDKLVLIAMNRPAYDETVHARNNATHELSKAKNAWLNLLAITMSFNEQDFEKPPPGQTTTLVYPKYFFGVNIPVGILFTRNSDIRIARENQYIAKDHQEEMASSIRAAVVGKYRAYVVYQQEIRMQTSILNDEQVAYQNAQKDFKDGKITLEVYNTASKGYAAEVTRKLSLILASDAIKTDLEQSLGMPLEDALRR